MRSSLPPLVAVLTALLALTGCGPDDAARSREASMEHVLEQARRDPTLLRDLLLQMPKGADLHNHLSAAAPVESLIRWGAADGYCLRTADFTAVAPPCGEGTVALSDARPGGELYAQIVSAWSMEGHQDAPLLERHQHFFDTFGKFGAITGRRTPDLIAEALQSAGAQHLQHVELMLGSNSSIVGRAAARYFPAGDAWTEEYLLAKRAALAADPEVVAAVEAARTGLADILAQARGLLRCESSQPDPGCRVQARFLISASRTQSREFVFGQFLFAFELVQVAPELVAGLNLVQPEEHPVSLRDYDDVMLGAGALQRHNTTTAGRLPVHVSLHAGELIPAVLPDTDEGRRHLTFHIRRAVERGLAERIGHGVDVLGETEGDGPEGLFTLLRDRKVLIEICLTSNQQLLGAEGTTHPLAAYRDHRVPVALATDDPGVLRSDLTAEYERAVADQNLGYVALKASARASLEHSFLPGKDLWLTLASSDTVTECSGGEPGSETPAARCKTFLDQNARAAAQWELERRLRAFEESLAR